MGKRATLRLLSLTAAGCTAAALLVKLAFGPGTQPPLAPPEPVAQPAAAATFAVQDITYTSALAQKDPAVDVSRPQPCAASMVAEPLAPAMLRLRIFAPCRGGAPLTLHHSGLIVSERLNARGEAELMLPALAQTAVVIADFEGAGDLVAQAEVTDINAVARVVVQAADQSGLQLHALEGGASWGEAGHVWSGAVAGSEAQAHGFVTLLGDPSLPDPHLAQVYTLPAAKAPTEAEAALDVALMLEVEITGANCDGIIEASIFEHRGDQLRGQALDMAVPDCAAIGEFLVLNNPVESLKVAAKE